MGKWLSLYVLALGLALPAYAELRSGQAVVIAADERVGEDLYVAASTVNVLGTVEGDLVVAASTVNINGLVTGDVLATAGTINVNGEVRGSVRAASGELWLHGTVAEDVAGAVGRLELSPGAEVGRDLALAAGRAKLSGALGGQLLAAAGDLELAGPVQGDVRATVGQLRLDPAAQLEGNLDYRSEQPASMAEGARVQGEINHSPMQQARGGVFAFLWLWSRALIGLFGLGVLLALLLPRFWGRAVEALPRAPAKNLGVGALVLFGAPVVVALLFALGAVLGGWWLGFFALALYFLVLAAAFPVVGAYVGNWLMARMGKSAPKWALALLSGVALLTFALRIPVLGALVALATLLLGAGALVFGALDTRRSTLAPA